jgi:hypothetical protein
MGGVSSAIPEESKPVNEDHKGVERKVDGIKVCVALPRSDGSLVAQQPGRSYEGRQGRDTWRGQIFAGQKPRWGLDVLTMRRR